MSSLSKCRLPRNSDGVVYVEFILAWVPVLTLAISAWQLIELSVADLLVRHAATVAARAAAVVLPDDPELYDGERVGEFTGSRRTDVELSAAWVLAISPRFRTKPAVEVTVEPSVRVVTAVVSVPVDCFLGGMNPLCLGSKRQLRAQATFPYQGARYAY